MTVRPEIYDALGRGVDAIMAADAELGPYLSRAKALVDRGRWWPKVREYMNTIETAAKDPRTTPEQIDKMMTGLLAGLKSGCQKIKGWQEKR